MKNEIMYFNETAFNESVRKANEFIKHAQPLLDHHYELGNLFPIRNADDILNKLMRGSGNYRNAIIDGLKVPEIAPGVKMKKEVYVQSLQFPYLTSFDSFVESHGGANMFSTEFLCKIENTKVILDPIAVEARRERHTYRADSPLKEEIYETHKAAADALRKLSSLLQRAGKGNIHQDDQYHTLFYAYSDKVEVRNDYYAGRGFIANDIK